MERVTRSYFLALRASARFSRAVKLRDAGKSHEALRVALEALAILGHPHVVRSNPAESSVLCCATILVEELSAQLNVTGANYRDLVEALQFIRAMGPGSDFAPWTSTS